MKHLDFWLGEKENNYDLEYSAP